MPTLRESLELFATAHRLVLDELKPFELEKFDGCLRQLICLRIDNDFCDPMVIARDVAEDVRTVLDVAESAQSTGPPLWAHQ